ncbi:MAG: hypothetical protein K0S26_3476 [Bacteroidota bacterium]|jgi:tetratricopeptide (TPR) repeat protein|nr:hypothetical protein [Bacteroidota bacterium]MDF2453972.1 hypothetical protein [Bacteroidota bacterium]
MKTLNIITAIVLAFQVSQAQPLKQPAIGGNKKAMVSEDIGITHVAINYDRPGVKGREGKIYGQLVHKGYEDLGFGTSKAAPWRAGANENTTIEFSTDVKIEGKELPAGKYGFFIAYNENECTIIFSKNNASWGSYFYDTKEDALRATVKPVAMDKSVEWLKYEFMNQTENSATVALMWEKLMIPFKVEVDLFKTQIAEYRNELRGSKGFTWEAWDQAASLCLQYNTNLEEGLAWANKAVLFEKNFQSLSTAAMLNEKLGKQQKSDSLMKVAMDMGKIMDIHFYGRRLLNQKRTKEALDVFKYNAKKNPKNFTTYVGLARGFSANGDYKNALMNAKAALPLAPDDGNKNAVAGMIKKLEESKDVN